MGQTGVEEPVHTVILTRDFYMGKYEVTNAEYVKFLNAQIIIDLNWLAIDDSDPGTGLASPYYGLYGDPNSPSGIKVKSGYEARPVMYVSWYGAIAYCNWLSDQYGFDRVYSDPNENPANWLTRNGYRLPTEAEWEYACRAGTGSEFYWGDDFEFTLIDNYAWYGGNSGDIHHNVGMKLPNNFGLYDMSGNVDEWCNDWATAAYDPNELPQIDPTGPVTGSARICRGGCYYLDAGSCWVFNRHTNFPGNCHAGFRICRIK